MSSAANIPPPVRSVPSLLAKGARRVHLKARNSPMKTDLAAEGEALDPSVPLKTPVSLRKRLVPERLVDGGL
jgi:hypothetical protein